MSATLPLLAVAAPGLSFSHHDWELACDNTGTCRAAGYQHDDGEGAVSVLLVRRAGPATPVQARVRLGDEEGAETPSTVELVVAGKPLGSISLDKESGEGGLQASQVSAVLKAALGDSEIVFRAGPRTWKLSGDGATAVLLRMDDAQRRLGTPSALVRKGAGDEARVPGPSAPPTVAAVPALPNRPADARLAAQIFPQLKAPADDCPGEPGDKTEPGIWRLDASHVLVSRLCWRGAYNEGYGFWVANDHPPFTPLLVTTSGQDFDGKDSIGAYHKGRGIGDCIGTDEWVWNGRNFVHTASSTSGMCKGIAAGGAWELPTLVSSVQRSGK